MKVKSSKQQSEDSLRARARLQTSDMLQMLVENATDYAITLLDKDGRVLTWSPAAQKLKGWLADEIIGQSFSRFYTAEDIKTGKPQQELDVPRKGPLR